MKTSLREAFPRLPVTEARERLADIVARVARAEDSVILTRHGKPVAAVVGLAQARRIPQVAEQDARIASGWIPTGLLRAGETYLATGEAAVRLRQVQLDRLAERRLIESAGLEVVPGGEVEAPVARVEAEAAPARSTWKPWTWRKPGL